jgi:toxin ParE1/3/4
MTKAVRTREATEDLDQIIRYIARDNVSAAVSWLDEMEALFGLLATQPEMGERIQTRRFGDCRRHVGGNYVTYDRPIADGIEVLHVVHGARDPRGFV